MTSSPKSRGPADHLCGVGTYRPEMLQVFANAKVFTLLYSVVLIFQSAQFYYFFGIMSTLQRRYGLSSWSVSVILFAVSGSPLFISFAVGHYSKKVSRPVLLFWGTAALAASCCMCAAPYFLFGPGAAVLTQGAATVALDVCPAAQDRDCLGQSSEPFVVAAVLFVANCLYGSAYSVLYIAGSTYVDDSVKKKNSPLHFAFMAIVKLLGPSLGYALAGLCLRYYEDPLYDPGLETTDPRWVGAWWLGYIMLAVCLAILSVPILLFPRRLSFSASPKHGNETDTKAKNKNVSFLGSVQTLFRNRVFTLRLVYWLLVMNVTLGHGMMSAKYMEVQYRTSASKASLLSGPVLLLTNALGVGLGGLVLHTFKPKPGVVASYTTLCDVLKLCCYVVCMLIGCQGIRMIGSVVDNQVDVEVSCSQGCNCTTRVFQPICVPEHKGVIFSPCFAGCRSTTRDGSFALEDCSCLTNVSSAVTDAQSQRGRPYLGLCDEYCENIIVFVALMSLTGFITRTTTVAHTIFGLRCVNRHEKAMALGVQEGLSSVFTYVPYPLFYGAIFDSSCIVWQDKCGRPGTCWVYDADKLRYTYHGVSSVILLLAAVFEVLMATYSGRISDFYDESTERMSPMKSETECGADEEETAKALTEEDEPC